MRKTSRSLSTLNTVCWVVTFCLMLLFGTSCDKFFGLTGVVTDCESQQPIEGVLFTLFEDPPDDSHATPTDSDGIFRMTLNHPANAPADLVIEHDGYEVYEQHFNESPGIEIEICLTPVVP